MRSFLVVALTLLSTSAFASGSFNCESLDGQIKVSGGDSSAGTWVQAVQIGADDLEKGTEFTAEQIYNGEKVFNFKIMDGEFNRTLLVVETVSNYPLAAGLVTLFPYSDKEETKVIVCDFSY